MIRRPIIRTSLPYAGLLVLCLAILSALAGYAFRGWYARYTADDYCTAGAERAFGFLGAQVYWYESWSGRFTYYLASGLIEFAGPRIVQVLPAIALLVWLATSTWAVLRVARRQHWPAPMISATALSGAVILVCLEGAPNLDQALYWQTGMLTYLLPLVLLTAYAGWLVRRAVLDDGKPVSALEVVASGAFLFLVGGISETSLSVQLVLLAVAAGLTGWLLWSRRYRQLPIVLLAGLLATIISAVIVVAAPGNYIHEARLTGSVHGWSQVPAALQASVDFVGLFVRTVEFRARSAVAILFFLSLSFGLCSFFSRLSPPLGGQGDGGWGERIDPTSAGTSSPVSTTRGWRLELAGILGAVACGWVLLIAAAIPGYFAQEWDPPERAQFVGVWVAAVALPIAAYLLGRLLARAARHPWLMPFAGPAALVWGVCLLVLSVGPLLDLRGTLALASSDAGYAAAWDALDATIRGQAVDGQPVVVNATLPSHFGFDFIVDDPGAYPNPCVAQFYGVPLIRSTGD